MKKILAIVISALLILTFTPPPVGNLNLGISVADAKQVKRSGRSQVKHKGRPSAGKPNRPNRPDRPGKPDRPNRPGKPDRPNKPGKPNRPNKPPHHGGHNDKYHNHRHYHRDDWYRYGAGFATGLAIGAIVSSLPSGCREVYVGGIAYQQCGSNWYRPSYQGSRIVYQVVADPR